MSQPYLRTATSEDWDQFLPLLKGMRTHDSEQEIKQRFATFISRADHYLPVALVNNSLVGYAWVQDYGPHLRGGTRSARLHDLFVLPEYRKQGCGAMLFHSVRDWAQQVGVRYLEWQSTQAALGFYERLGYKGDPCPQPEYPFFEIEFTQATP